MSTGENERWGQLVSPGFPDQLATPLSCAWILDNSALAARPGWSLYLYFTQVGLFISLQVNEDYKGVQARGTNAHGAPLKEFGIIENAPIVQFVFGEGGGSAMFRIAKLETRLNLVSSIS